MLLFALFAGYALHRNQSASMSVSLAVNSPSLLPPHFIPHFHPSLSSLTFIPHFHPSLPSLTSIPHFHPSLPSLTSIPHFHPSLPFLPLLSPPSFSPCSMLFVICHDGHSNSNSRHCINQSRLTWICCTWLQKRNPSCNSF